MVKKRFEDDGLNWVIFVKYMVFVLSVCVSMVCEINIYIYY